MAPELSLFFFACETGDSTDPNKYELLLQSARLADELGLRAVWVPERHFLRFGGLYGSPSVTAAAVSVLTKRLRIRAGSVVLPLHDPLRVAEEWAMIDNLSKGRVDMAIASGWHPNDFVLAPGAYERRHEVVAEHIDIVKRLWRGERIARPNGRGDSVEVRILPRPIQPELPLWLTVQSEAGFNFAAENGYNVLTSNFAQQHDPKALRARIAHYRSQMNERHGRPGHITLMAHTFVGDRAAVDGVAFKALFDYIRLNREMFASIPNSRSSDERRQNREADIGTDRIFRSPLTLMGTPEECRRRCDELAALGVDEIACLMDFGVPLDASLETVRQLATLI